MNIQICLVSQQVIQNILPVLELKPDLLIFLYTKEFENKIEGAISVLTKRLPELKFEKVLTDAYDFDKILASCNLILKKFPDADFTLNLTGGTKVMAIATYSAFEGESIIYCDTTTNQILELDEIPTGKIAFTKQLTIEEYFDLYGFRITEETTENSILKRKKLAMFLGENIGKLEGFLLDCRRALSGDERFTFPVVSSEPKISVSQNQSTDKLKIEFVFNGEKSKLEIDRKFIEGFWLEEYVFWKLKNKGFAPKLGVKIFNGNIKNEIDLCLIQDNKLFWISCKSGDYKKTDLAEVEQFKNLFGGPFGTGVFVTVGKIGELEKRANELGIQTIDSKNLQALANLIGEKK